MAKHMGARVIGTTSSEEKADIAKRAGADDVILYTRTNFADEARKLTNGKGVDFIIDGLGKATFLTDLKAVRTRGTIVVRVQDRVRIDFAMADNAFVRIADWQHAQALADAISPKDLHGILDRYAASARPDYGDPKANVSTGGAADEMAGIAALVASATGERSNPAAADLTRLSFRHAPAWLYRGPVAR